MRRLLPLVLLLCMGQAWPIQPRPGAVASQNNSGTLPSGTPLPANPPCPQCSPPNMGGQSSTITGAVNLTGCLRYAVTVYPGSSSCTLNAVGTEQVSYWPAGTPPSITVTTWPRNAQLDELHSSAGTVAAGQPVHFPGHAADGIGWIQVTPASVTQTGGCTTVFTLIEGSQCGS
jgi:hypothetical protein